jgi:hypothetical protein
VLGAADVGEALLPLALYNTPAEVGALVAALHHIAVSGVQL